MSTEELRTLKDMVQGAYGAQVTDESVIHDAVDKLRPLFAPAATDEEIEHLKRELSSELYITVERGVSITSKDVKPWLEDKRATITWDRWEAYRRYLLKEGRPPAVMARLHEDTDNILDLMGDPTDPGPWQRRGLVVGDVQSGKTSTYLGLLNKAVDAGFRVVILLGGHTESLRQQTQKRVDAGFLGYDTQIASASNVLNNKRPLGVGFENKAIQPPHALTTTAQDYSKKSNQGSVIQLHEPTVLVVKKNAHVFDAVNSLLGQQHPNDQRITEPLLILDDESDYASVNTADPEKDATRINDGIQKMLAHSERGMYVAFTATPFANIFIDPDQPQDLFPRDFVYALESPTNYFGASRTFAPAEQENDPTVTIKDADKFFPPRHKSTLTVPGLPPSLKDAIRAFMIVNALRDLRGNETPPERSMLINVSTFKKVQRQVGQLVGDFLEEQRNAVVLHAEDPATQTTTPQLIELARVHDKYFAHTGIPWPTVLRALPDAISEIEVMVFNSDSEKRVDDSNQPLALPQRLIAVGGNVLSRGLTLEGLTISYFYRQVRAADTLLQMARWFGYRKGYDDLCRVWITKSTAEDFRYIAEAVDELKTELRRMREMQLTPRDFGLRVKKHPGALLVTAKNKSRSAEEVPVVVSLLGRRIETSKLSANPQQIDTNKAALTTLLSTLGPLPPGQETLTWKNRPRTAVVDFLTVFRAHPSEEIWFGNSLRDYVRDSDWNRLDTWDIVLVQGRGTHHEIAGQPFRAPTRTIVGDSDGKLMVSGKASRLAGSDDVRSLIAREDAERIANRFLHDSSPAGTGTTRRTVPEVLFYEALENPVLMVYPLEPTGSSTTDPAEPWRNDLLVGAKIALPGKTDMTSRSKHGDVRYLINKTAQRAWNATDYSVSEEQENDD